MGSISSFVACATGTGDVYFQGWMTGGIVGAAGRSALEYYARDRPLRTLPHAALLGMVDGSSAGGTGALMGHGMEYVTNATRSIIR